MSAGHGSAWLFNAVISGVCGVVPKVKYKCVCVVRAGVQRENSLCTVHLLPPSVHLLCVCSIE